MKWRYKTSNFVSWNIICLKNDLKPFALDY
jgi:hypothetical protein